MLEVDVNNYKITVKLDPTSSHYIPIYKIVKKLLTSREVGSGWIIGYDDLIVLKDKLNALGLTEGRRITDEAINFINYIKDRDERNQKILEGVEDDNVKNILMGKLKVDLYPDQINAVAYTLNNRRCGLFFGMGSGKTLISLSTAIASGCEKILVVCPKSVLHGFYKQVHDHTYMKAVKIPSGGVEAKKFIEKNKDGDWNVCLVHPENLVARSTKRKKALGPYSDVYKILKNIDFDMIIIDEFHQYKNIGKKRSQCIVGLLTEVRDSRGKWPRAIVMTGTPVSESPNNAYSVLRVVGYDKLPTYVAFENYFTKKETVTIPKKGQKFLPKEQRETVTFKKVTGYKNLRELKRRIGRVSIQRSKDDLKGFPDKVEQTRYLELKGDQKSIYKAICKEIRDALPMDTEISLSEFIDSAPAVRLRQVLNSPGVLDLKGNSVKYDEVDNILEELFEDPEQKVILWSEYRRGVDLLYDRYNKKYGAVKIYGGVETEEIEEAFIHDDKLRVAVCIPAKAGTGVDFLARARTAIYIDLPYSYTHYKQSLDRIHRRVSQAKELSRVERIRAQPATLIFLEVENTIDTLVREKLQQKDDISKALIVEDEKLIKIGRRDLLKILK